jgi:hypothetical protein
MPCHHQLQKLYDWPEPDDKETIPVLLPSLRAIMKWSRIVKGLTRKSLIAFLRLLIPNIGVNVAEELLKQWLANGIIHQGNISQIVFEQEVNLNTWLKDVMKMALPDNLDSWVDMLPDLGSLVLDISGLGTLLGFAIEASGELKYGEGDLLWLTLIFSDRDLVPIDQWLDSAAGYLAEPGLLGSEFLDDLAWFIPGFGQIFGLFDIFLEMWGEVDTWLEKAADAIKRYNELRLTLLMVLSTPERLKVWLYEMIPEEIREAGLVGDFFEFVDEFVSAITPYLDPIKDLVEATMPPLPELDPEGLGPNFNDALEWTWGEEIARLCAFWEEGFRKGPWGTIRMLNKHWREMEGATEWFNNEWQSLPWEVKFGYYMQTVRMRITSLMIYAGVGLQMFFGWYVIVDRPLTSMTNDELIQWYQSMDIDYITVEEIRKPKRWQDYRKWKEQYGEGFGQAPPKINLWDFLSSIKAGEDPYEGLLETETTLERSETGGVISYSFSGGGSGYFTEFGGTDS